VITFQFKFDAEDSEPEQSQWGVFIEV